MDPNNFLSMSSSQEREILHKQIGDLRLSLRSFGTQSIASKAIFDEKLGQIIDQTVVGIYRSTIDGKLIMANAALAQIFGYGSPEKMMEVVNNIGEQLYDDPSRRNAWYESFHDQEMVGPVLWCGKRSDHELLWLEEYARVIRDSQGEILGFEGVVLDVTARDAQDSIPRHLSKKGHISENMQLMSRTRTKEQLQIELADAQQMIAILREQLDRFEIATLGSQEGLWEGRPLPDRPWDSPETPAWYSSQFKALLGFEDHEFPPVLNSWASRIHPEDRDRVFQALRNHIEHHVPYDVDSRLRTKQGVYRWFKGKGQAIYDEQGNVVRGGGTIRDITAQKEAEDALKSEHALLTTVVEGTSDIIFVKDHFGRYLLVNSTGATLLGREIEEVIGKTDAELFPNGTHPLFTQGDQDVVREKATQSFEIDVENAGAVSRTFLVTKAIFSQTEEGLEGLFCIARDITFRKAAELTIQEREKRYRAIMDNAYDLIAEVDGSATFLYVSSNFEEVLGYAPSTLLGTNIFSFVHPDDQAAVVEEFTRGMQRAGSGCSIYRYRHSKGGYRWFESTGRVFQTALGEVRGVVVSRDITERKEAENALTELNIALTHEAPGIALMDHEGRYLQMNSAYAALFGYLPEQLLGKSWKISVHPDDHSQALAALKSMREMGIGEFEARGIRRDGSELFIKIVMVRGINKAEGEGCYHCFMRDITDRKQMEKALGERDQKLQQVQKMEAIGTLAGGIAHDFNNILGAILGYSELAMAQAKNEPRLISYLEEVLTAGHRAKELVKQILAFSRRSDHEREAVDLKAIVQEALRMVRATLPTTIDIQFEVALDSAVVFADSTQMHQVIMNLCSNAEQAMREQGGVLSLTVSSTEVPENLSQEYPELKPGTYLQLTIQDSGKGMPREVLERIFEPFFTTKGLGEGTGLGLAVVHGIIAGHGGHIAVSSSIGQGTTFKILLPRLDVVLPAQRTNAIDRPHGTGTILFVDDEDVLARWGEQVLTHLGYTVVAKTNPHEAVEYFRSWPNSIDLVVTDQTMPTMSGEALVRAFLEIRQDIPIVLCTGFSHTMSEEKADRLGVKGFLMKPVNGAALAKTLQELLEDLSGPSNESS